MTATPNHALQRTRRAVTPAAQQSPEMVTLDCGKVFAWPRGLCLQATEASAFVFPGALIDHTQPVGSVIHASDDETQIGFQPDPSGTGFLSITAILKPGQSLTLHRASEVMHASLTAADKRPKEFVVLSRA
jgi:hypothetical protein